jgi:mono/diheme cytochrome c family protein
MENVMIRQQKRAGILLVFVSIILISSVILGTSACNSSGKATAPAGSTTAPSSGVSFSKDIQPIFNNNCVICHQGKANGYASLSLEPKLSYSNLVGVPSTEDAAELRIKAGDPGQSYLLAKLNGTQVQAGGSGAQMPYGATPLAQAQIDMINLWIIQGGLNN